MTNCDIRLNGFNNIAEVRVAQSV